MPHFVNTILYAFLLACRFGMVFPPFWVVLLGKEGQMAIKQLVSRYRSKCSRCNGLIDKGEEIQWDSDTRQSWHNACDSPSPFGVEQERVPQDEKEDLPF